MAPTLEHQLKNKTPKINAVFDAVMVKFELKNDVALSKKLGLTPQVVCNVRSGRLSVSPTTILAIHEHGGIAVPKIRAMLADEAVAP